MFGELQLEKLPESTRHWKLEPASELEKPKVGVESLVAPLGPESIVVFGGVVSPPPPLTVNVRLAGLGSTLPAASLARTENVCEPFARVPSVYGDVQEP